MKSTTSRVIASYLVWAATLMATSILIGCGSSSSPTPSPNPTPTPTPAVVTVALNQSSASLLAGTTTQFNATVTGSTNTAVTWSVDSVAGGNSTVGTVSASGLYTAPMQAGSHNVTATSVADTKDSASAKVTITVASVSVSPSSATVVGSASEQFSATVQGATNLALAWSVDQISGGNSTVGTVSSTGLYTAPSQPGSHTVTASGGGGSSSAAVNVFTMSVSPGSSTVAPSASQQFSASIQGLSNTAVTWSVDGVAGGNATTGLITSTGMYTAPSSLGAHTIAATSAADTSVTVSASITIVNLATAAVLTYHNDDTRDGAYTQEVTLTPSNVNSTQFGKLLAYPVDGQIYAQPLYMSGLSIGGGTYDVVFVTTQNNSVYAFDADATSSSTAQTFWHINLGTPISFCDTGGPCPYEGILSTPVIDATTNTMYLVAEKGPNDPSPFKLYGINVTTGAITLGPVVISASYSGDSLETSCYQRMGLALNPVTNWLYIAFGSCDNGWVVAYDKETLTQQAVFESTNGAQGGGFWGSDAAPAVDDASGNVYLMSGTDYDDNWIQAPPTYTQIGYNDSFLNLNATTLDVQSSFTPNNNYYLAGNDVDLGSGGAILVPGNSTYPNVLIGGGKDGAVFVVNPLNMGGFNSTNNVIQSNQICSDGNNNIFSTPVYWNGSIYYHCNDNVIRAYSWSAGTTQMSTSPTSSGSVTYQMHGATPSLSANGSNDGIIWDVDNSAYTSCGCNPTATGTDPSGPMVLHAYDATNVASELYNSTQAGSRDTAGLALKFTVPTIVNGRVFVPTATELDIYGLLAP